MNLSRAARPLSGLIVLLSATASVAQSPTFEPFKPSGIYELGETVGWRVIQPAGSNASDSYSYVIRKNNLETLQSGPLDLSQPASIEVALDEPAMVYVEIRSTQPDSKVIALGAAVAPDRLQPSVAEPADFDRFWARKIRDLQRVPARPELTRKPSDVDGVDYFTLRMNHVGGKHIHGQIAKPQRSGKFPGLVIFQWASPPYPAETMGH